MTARLSQRTGALPVPRVAAQRPTQTLNLAWRGLMFRLSNPLGWVIAVIAAVVGVLGAAATVDARFMRPDLVTVPVTRIIENLEQLVQKNPKDVTLRFNLARAHAMA